MIEIKARNARNSSGWSPRDIAKFCNASVPAFAHYPRPTGNADIDYFSLKLSGHDLFRGSLNKRFGFKVVGEAQVDTSTMITRMLRPHTVD